MKLIQQRCYGFRDLLTYKPRLNLALMPRTEDQLREQLQRLQARDWEQRAAVASFGVDLGKRRVIDLNFLAADEQTANRLRDALIRNEFAEVRVVGPANGRWVVRSSVSASVDYITAKENVATFLLFADEYECEYDGWGTAIVEAVGYRA